MRITQHTFRKSQMPAAAPYERAIVQDIERAIRSRVALLQAIVGPRQVGKSTAAAQLVHRLGWPSHVAAADAPLPHPPEWIETQWEIARRMAGKRRAVLVLDEIQKVPGWSEVVKRLWDEDRRARSPLRVLLLGSSSLLSRNAKRFAQLPRQCR